jgi:hypothetical protein
MVHRGVATVASALVVCFLLLSHFDAQFFLFHFYESLIYLVIVLMLFYFEDRWAYMMGMVAPAVWLILTVVWSGLPGVAQQILIAFQPGHAFLPSALLTFAALTLSVVLIVWCAFRWRREFAGLKKGWSTFLVSFGVIAVYYALMVVWLLRWPPSVA